MESRTDIAVEPFGGFAGGRLRSTRFFRGSNHSVHEFVDAVVELLCGEVREGGCPVGHVIVEGGNPFLLVFVLKREFGWGREKGRVKEGPCGRIMIRAAVKGLVDGEVCQM